MSYFGAYFYITILVFTYIFPIKFNFLPLDTGKLLVIYSFIVILLKYRCRFPYVWAKYIIFSMICILMAISVMLLNMVYDGRFLLSMTALLSYTFPAILIGNSTVKICNYEHKSPIHVLLKIILSVIVLQGIISLAIFLIPNLKGIILNLITIDGIPYDIEVFSFRLISLSKIQFGNMAVIYGLGLWIWIYERFGNCDFCMRNKLRDILYLCIIIISGILSARTFFLAIAVGFVYWSILVYKKYKLKVIVYLLFGAITIGLSFFILLSWLKNSEYQATYQWAFEWYINLLDGNVETKSTNVMKDMYVLPDNTSTWIFGDGKMTDNNGFFYMNTDIGYLRNLYRWGIVGSLIFYLILFALYRMNVERTNDNGIKSLFGVIIIWTFIYQFKELWAPTYIWPLFLGVLSYNKITKNTSDIYNYDFNMHSNA